MRVSVLVLSLIGGVIGVMFSFLALALSGTANALAGKSGDSLVGRSALGLVTAVLAILFGCLHYGGKARTWMATLLSITALVHFFLIGYFGIPGGVFLILAAIFAWVARRGPMPALSYPPQFAPQFAGTTAGFMAAPPKLPPAAFCASCGQPGQERGKFCGACGAVVP